MPSSKKKKAFCQQIMYRFQSATETPSVLQTGSNNQSNETTILIIFINEGTLKTIQGRTR